MATAHDILIAVKTIVEATLPDLQVHLRRASEMHPLNDKPGIVAVPCFTVAVNEDRATQMAYAGKKFVKYPVTLTYLTKELPGDRAASEDIETVQAQVAKLFLASRDAAGKPGLKGVTVVSDCDIQPKAPYQLPLADQTLCCSPLLLTFETIENAF